MASLGTLRDELQTRLQTISGLNAYDVWPDSITAPAAIVMPASPAEANVANRTVPGMRASELIGASPAVEYERTVAGPDTNYRFDIHLLVAEGSNGAAAQDTLDAYISDTGASSVPAAILGDTTLNGAADDLRVVRCRFYGARTVESTAYYGAVLEVEVWTD
ncbi:MAG: hypothetical protein OXO54_11845 [Chloroflexota bacterium]|nr:hypothetical protein [Chloroflexota bacterium]MDE2899005.1 hypothetical protein [Chloroflexota bacterium]